MPIITKLTWHGLQVQNEAQQNLFHIKNPSTEIFTQ